MFSRFGELSTIGLWDLPDIIALHELVSPAELLRYLRQGGVTVLFFSPAELLLEKGQNDLGDMYIGIIFRPKFAFCPLSSLVVVLDGGLAWSVLLLEDLNNVLNLAEYVDASDWCDDDDDDDDVWGVIIIVAGGNDDDIDGDGDDRVNDDSIIMDDCDVAMAYWCEDSSSRDVVWRDSE